MVNAVRDYWLQRFDGVTKETAAINTKTRIECADGFSMSVKAGKYWCSEPKHFLGSGDYSAWEIGFPSDQDELLMPYAQDGSHPTKTVYSYVPTQIVNQVIAKHGGMTGISNMPYIVR